MVTAQRRDELALGHGPGRCVEQRHQQVAVLVAERAKDVAMASVGVGQLESAARDHVALAAAAA